MPMVDGDWTITRSNGNIRYTGADHGVGTTVTTGAFVVGTYYRIVVVGDTDFTLIGASASTVGIEFVATGVGGGTTGKALEVASYATVIEFHRWLQDFADDASSTTSDDELDITDDTPSDRSTDNIITLLGSYNIDDGASQHLYDGSIIQGDGDVIYDGIVNFGNQEVMIQLLQSGVVISDDWWNYKESGTHTGGTHSTILTDSDQTWVADEWIGYIVLNTTDGSRGLITDNDATTITVAELSGGTADNWESADAYLIAKGLNSDSAGGISHRFMVKTRTGGADTDNRRLVGLNRRYGFTYGEFNIPATARGNNVLALSDAADLNNAKLESVVEGYTGITNVKEGYSGIDASGDSTDEYYYSEWNTNQPTRSINDFYERMKYLTRDGETTTLYGLPGEAFRGITHQVAITPGTGTWVEPESLSWGTGPTAGTGQLLAVDDTDATATSKLWLQLLSGVAPAANLITGNGSATGTAGTVTERSISTPFVGASTGSAIIGAYGLGIESDDLTASDKVFDLDNTQITPPNNVTFTVFGVVSDEDRVLVTNDNSSAIDFAQMTLDAALTTGSVTNVQVQPASIPADTPSPSGVIRIEMDDGRYRRIPYTALPDTTNFTIGTTSFSGDEAADDNNVFLAYIDELADGVEVTTTNFVTGVRYRITVVGDTDFTLIGAASNTVGLIFTATGPGGGTTGTADTVDVSVGFTTVYDSERTLFVRVRDGGTTPIKTFETTGTLGSSGGSATAIRTSDE